MQNLGKWLEYFSQNQPMSNFSPGMSQLIKMAPSILKNAGSIAFGTAIASVILVGTSLADMHYTYR
jgi:hypothetical protein